MKCHLEINKIFKNLIFYAVCTIISTILIQSQSPKQNIYKKDKQIKHSLFREKDSIDRMSIQYTSIPERIE